ncbi:unnamed protein product [Hydatigera taeniaeformis]|uniref:BPTI/Kunitz inhibitor domain-containing protein n=1 Tax=Hydatigena taeniaeformis TaxID=6205 RepID=A0A0R3WTG4_HYDTA|nr:unnamed protein product [Hydatigera taeniaeformis]
MDALFCKELSFNRFILVSGKSEICKLPIAPGNCKDRFVSWGYDASKGHCVRFVYTGCGGNDNRFRTNGICKRVCVDHSTKKKH